MDTSEEYKKMSDCPEIQEQFGRLQLGEDEIWTEDMETWLPTQDQIQEMLGYPMLYCLRMLYMRFHPGFEPDSFEQLWLAFYMHETHKKIWTGGKWVKRRSK